MSIEENQGLPFGFEPNPGAEQEDIELLSTLARDALCFAEESSETSYALHCGSGNIYFRVIVDEQGESVTKLEVTNIDDETTLLEILYDDKDTMIAGSIEGDNDDVIDDEIMSETIEQLDDICKLIKDQEGLSDEETSLLALIERIARMYRMRSDEEMTSYINRPSASTIASVIRSVIEKRQAPKLTIRQFSHSIEGAGILGVTGYKVERLEPDHASFYPELVASFEPNHDERSDDFILPWPEHGLPVTRVFSEEDETEDEDPDRPDKQVVSGLIGHFMTFLSAELTLGDTPQ